MADTVEIPLRRVDGSVRAVALIDSMDAERVSVYRWHLGAGGYVLRNAGRTSILLHRFILGLEPGDGLEGEHEDNNPLNNRRSNLRICAHALNGQNRASGNRGSSSPFRGVSWSSSHKKWKAAVKLDGKTHYLGRFDNEEEAAEVAASFRSEHMPFSKEASVSTT